MDRGAYQAMTTLSDLIARLADWWRGYSDADVASVAEKIRETPPGHFVRVTNRELRTAVKAREARR